MYNSHLVILMNLLSFSTLWVDVATELSLGQFRVILTLTAKEHHWFNIVELIAGLPPDIFVP